MAAHEKYEIVRGATKCCKIQQTQRDVGNEAGKQACFSALFFEEIRGDEHLFGIQGLLGTVLALFMSRDKIGWKKVMK
ncbi:hypothetical protein [Selenomonas felix]|uniref:hypothetical protein n=1 Tax=Selenomonas felix TaxID=1944634 RepID=UPI0023567F4F|nr:hypothetical protein [Selenomonas felix]